MEILEQIMTWAGGSAGIAAFIWMAFKQIASMTTNTTDDKIVSVVEGVVGALATTIVKVNETQQNAVQAQVETINKQGNLVGQEMINQRLSPTAPIDSEGNVRKDWLPAGVVGQSVTTSVGTDDINLAETIANNKAISDAQPS